MNFRFLFVRRFFTIACLALFAWSGFFDVSAQKPEATPATENKQSSARVVDSSNAESGEAATTENSEANAKNETFAGENLIHLGDVIDIDVLGSLEYDWRGQLDSSGFLTALPYTKNSVFGLCHTEEELAGSIAVAYAEFLRNPQIIVRVVDRSARQQAKIFGAVKTPLRLQIERPAHLNEIIVSAGGITERASGEIKIFRPANLSCSSPHQVQAESQVLAIKISDLLAGKSEANPLIRMGDIVTIEEAKPIFVTGDVAAPQTVFFRNQKITLTRAVASAGGTGKDTSKITIFRRTADGISKTIEADYQKILKNQSEDVVLEAFDIVEVGERAGGKTAKSQTPFPVAGETNQSNLTNLPLRIFN